MQNENFTETGPGSSAVMLVQAIFEGFLADLSRTLERDLKRKLVETQAFHILDEWWKVFTAKFPDMDSSLEESNRYPDKPGSDASDALSRSTTSGLVSMLFASGGGLTENYMGIKNSIPKMPSFKRKVVPPAQPSSPCASPVPSEKMKSSDSESSRPSSPHSLSSDSSENLNVRRKQKGPSLSSGIQEDTESEDEVENKEGSRRLYSSHSDSDAESSGSSSDLEEPMEDTSGSESESDVERVEELPELPAKLEPINDENVMKVVGVYNPLSYDHTYANLSAIPPNWRSSVAQRRVRDKEHVVTGPQRGVLVPIQPKIPVGPSATYSKRLSLEEEGILKSFKKRGFDNEDRIYLKRSFERIAESAVKWATDSVWTDDIPCVAKLLKVSCSEYYSPSVSVNKSGCARTEGYVKPRQKEKEVIRLRARQATFQQTEAQSQQQLNIVRQQVQKTREARSLQRRLLTSLGDVESDLLKVNQLKYRKKLIKFGRSHIHNWGLFAMEPIAADEMIVEYVGQQIRLNVAERREKSYEKVGIGSSYLFRMDADSVIDATKCGNLARFINHCCNPNCYAKIVSVENSKRIVIYSKQAIAPGEEITYDYKFPIEDDKIPCACQSPQCRGTLN